MEKNRFNSLIALILSLISLNLMADTKSYKIELLVFAQDKPSSEVFDQYESQIEWPRNVANSSRYQQANVSLGGMNEKLQGNGDYHPLMHVAWIQSVDSNRLSTAVKIQNPSRTINGFFRIKRGHYLHMITDLEFNPTGSVIYRLEEKRRFKLKDVHYLDHPKFGVIVRVYPL